MVKQLVGWESDVELGALKGKGRSGEIGVILPRTVVMGTGTYIP